MTSLYTPTEETNIYVVYYISPDKQNAYGIYSFQDGTKYSYNAKEIKDADFGRGRKGFNIAKNGLHSVGAALYAFCGKHEDFSGTIIIHTNSNFVVDNFRNLNTWAIDNFVKKSGRDVKNKVLWIELYNLIESKGISVKFVLLNEYESQYSALFDHFFKTTGINLMATSTIPPPPMTTMSAISDSEIQKRLMEMMSLGATKEQITSVLSRIILSPVVGSFPSPPRSVRPSIPLPPSVRPSMVLSPSGKPSMVLSPSVKPSISLPSSVRPPVVLSPSVKPPVVSSPLKRPSIPPPPPPVPTSLSGPKVPNLDLSGLSGLSEIP